MYTGHTYPSNLPWYLYHAAMTFTQLFIDNPGHPYSAPFWMGEFGTGTRNSENWQNILRLLEENDLDFAYWSVDGYKYPGRGGDFGLLEDDFQTVRAEWKLKQLQRLMPVLKGSTSTGPKAVFLYPIQLLYRLSLTTSEKFAWLPWTIGNILEKNNVF